MDKTMICQSCEMPLEHDEVMGTNADGSLNRDYCIYCYKEGKLTLFCQSCGIPLTHDEVLGTNADNSLSEEYCVYCYKEGKFTADITMDEMIDISLTHMKEIFKDNPDFSEKDALAKMKSFFPELKRWKK